MLPGTGNRLNRKLIVGDTDEEKWNSVEQILRRATIPSPNTTTVITPAIPISVSEDTIPVDGVLLKKMLVSKGIINHIKIFCEKMEKKVKGNIVIRISESGKSGVSTDYTYPFSEGLTEYEYLTISVPDSARLRVRVELSGEGVENTSGLSVAFAYAPDTSQQRKEAFVVENLADKIQEEELRRAMPHLIPSTE